MQSLRPAWANESSPSVLADAIPGTRARDALLVLGYTGLIALGAQLAVHIPGTPVPITAQTFVVLLGAIVLGARRAVAGSILYLGVGLAGVPWFAAASTASLGYVFGFVAAALCIGWASDRGLARGPVGTALLMAVGNVIVYVVGAGYLMAYLHVGLSAGWNLGVQPFLVGDAVKIALATALVPAAWRFVRPPA